MDSAKNVFATFESYQTLTVTISGTDGASGSVISDPQGILPKGISCPTGSCTSKFPLHTQVTILQSADRISTFSNWGGDCTGNGECKIAMSGPMSISANFVLAPKVIVGKLTYSSLYEAYYDALTGSTIMTIDSDLPDIGLDINDYLGKNKTITIEGGYKADYSARSGLSTYLRGPLYISSGTLKVDGLIIKP